MRQGYYEPSELQGVELLLRCVQLNEHDSLPRRFVSLVWMIPSFMEWQLERVGELGGDVASLQRDANAIRTVLEELLGAP
jgi:hypothetical protein